MLLFLVQHVVVIKENVAHSKTLIKRYMLLFLVQHVDVITESVEHSKTQREMVNPKPN